MKEGREERGLFDMGGTIILFLVCCYPLIIVSTSSCPPPGLHLEELETPLTDSVGGSYVFQVVYNTVCLVLLVII